LYLLRGLSQFTLLRPSFSGVTQLTTAEADRIHVDVTRTRPWYSEAVYAGPLASRRSEPSTSDTDSGLSSSDTYLASDDDGCSSEDELGRLSTMINVL
jgi:hypothetical protein